MDEFDVDIGMLDEIEERLDTYYKLKRKYGTDVASVLEYYNKAQEKLDNIEFAQEKLEALYGEKEKILAELSKAADKLTKERINQFDNMAGEIQKSLEFLNMPFVRLSLNIEDKEYSADGKDELNFILLPIKVKAQNRLQKLHQAVNSAVLCWQ